MTIVWGPWFKERVTVHKLVVQESVAGIWSVTELTDFLPVDGKGDVGGCDSSGNRVRKDIEHVHCRSSEVE